MLDCYLNVSIASASYEGLKYSFKCFFFFFFILQFVFLSLSVYFGFSVGKGGKKPFKLVEKPELKPLLKVLLGSMCLLADCQ